MAVISGVQVDFPFQPYPAQIDYMEKVIEALQTSQHALLESPTGTGKTLCLLCSTLAWRLSFIAKNQLDTISKTQSLAVDHKNNDFFQSFRESLSSAAGKENRVSNSGDTSLTVDEIFQSFGSSSGIQPIPRIIYTSRTHSQLAQAVGQLRKSIYRPRVITLGSREQLCIHPQVSQLRGSEQNRLCRSLCESKGCKFRNKLKNSQVYEKVEKEILDLEDLVNFGRKEEVCPYYLSKEMEPTSELIFLPYNYLVDPSLRESLRFDFSNDVILFDEAHHIEEIAANCASFDLTCSLLDACISQLQRIKSKGERIGVDDQVESYSKDTVSLLLALFRALANEMNHLLDDSTAEELVHEPRFLFQLLSKVNLTRKTLDTFSSKIEQLFGERNHMNESDTLGDSHQYTNEAIFIFLKYMHLLFRLSEEEASRSYVVCIYRERQSEVMKQLVKGIRCLVLTSGTLGPLSVLENELQIPFPIQLENRHIIETNQLFVGMVGVGPSGEVLNSSYRNRSLVSYKRELGRCIYNFSMVIPGGILVFFPSYHLLMDCVEYWKTYSMQSIERDRNDFVSIWDSIGRRKSLVVETQGESDFHENLRIYQNKVNDSRSNGCILFAVCRGRMSEGIDFSDDYARAVVLVGIPFPPLQQRKVRMKQHYLSTVKKENPQRWYRLEAVRAINQAIGRVIRHEKDFGAIILCDQRFPSMVHQLSSWIQPFVNTSYSFGKLQSALNQFFKSQAARVKRKEEVSPLQVKMPKLVAGDEQNLFQAIGK